MNRLSRRIPVASSVVAVALAASTVASAAVVSYSTPFSLTDLVPEGEVDVAGFAGTLSALQLLVLPRFDPSFGTLQGVQIQFQSTYEPILRGIASDTRSEFVFFPFGESNDTGIDVSIDGTLRLALTDPGGSLSTLAFPLVNAFCTDQLSSDGFPSCIAQTASPTTYGAVLPLGAIAPAHFVGFDPIDLAAQFNAFYSGSCDKDDLGDACTVAVRLNWSGEVGVAYTYEAAGGTDPPGGDGGGTRIDAPGSTPLIAVGVGLLAAFVRRAAPSRTSAR